MTDIMLSILTVVPFHHPRLVLHLSILKGYKAKPISVRSELRKQRVNKYHQGILPDILSIWTLILSMNKDQVKHN